MRNEDLMRLLAGIGGGVALIEAIFGFNERHLDSTRIITLIVAIILAVVALLAVIKPGNPVPLNWILLVVIGIIMIIYSSLAGGILTLVAGFIGYTER